MTHIVKIFWGIVNSGVQMLNFSLIPGANDHPELSAKFTSGKFEWSDILAYGLYLIRMALEIAGMVAILMVMLGGFRYLMPNEEAKEKGKESLTNAIIGFVLVVLAWTIVDLIITFLTSG